MNLPSKLKAHTTSIVFSKNNFVDERRSSLLAQHSPESETNALLNCSATVFEHFHRIVQNLASNENKQTLTRFLETLQQHYQQLGYSQDTALAAHYAICATLDDLLRQHAKHSLHATTSQNDAALYDGQFLQSFHQSQLESEKFYSILEHISTQPEKYIDLLELMYLCLRFGYKGQYRQTPFGLQQWALLTDNTYRLITATRGQPSQTLSPDLINISSVVLPATSIITKKRRRFYVFTTLIFIVCAIAAGFIFQQAYEASQDTSITTIETPNQKGSL